MLPFFKKYFIDTQLYVALMGTLLSTFFMFKFNNFEWSTFALVFITYFFGYAYDEFQYTPFIKPIIAFGIIGAGICFLIMIQNHHLERVFRWLVIVIIGLLYDSFFLKYNFRKVPFFKIFYVGLVWAMMNAWLVLPHFHLGVFLVTIIFISALILPFDIHDMEKDRGVVVTFPLVYGIKKTRLLSYLMMFVTLLIAYYFMDGIYLIAYALTIVMTCILIYLSKFFKKTLYYTFVLESCSALPLLLVIVFRYIIK